MEKLNAKVQATGARVWARFASLYTLHTSIPELQISKRLKTTAGFCYHEKRVITLCYDLLLEYPGDMYNVIIPHEIAHQVDWDIYKESGHGKTWKSIMVKYGLPPDRCHKMTNTKWEARKVGL